MKAFKRMIQMLRESKVEVYELAFGCFGFARYSEREKKLRWYHGFSSFMMKSRVLI